jgi:hypothetical protein
MMGMMLILFAWGCEGIQTEDFTVEDAGIVLPEGPTDEEARLCLADCTTAAIADCEWPVAEECVAAQVACRAACPASCAREVLSQFYSCVLAADAEAEQEACIEALCGQGDRCAWLDPIAAWYQVYYCWQRPE